MKDGTSCPVCGEILRVWKIQTVVVSSVYGYQIDELEDSCYGFYGYDHEKSGLLDEAKSVIDHHISSETVTT